MTSSPDSMSPHAQALPPIPPSPSRSFASTAFPTASLNLTPPPPPLVPGHFLSHGDVMASITAYGTLSEAAKAYRKALSALAQTASAFGAALETCARCKGAGDNADGLMGAGGLQYLVASNMHILSESIYRGFEVPLLHELDTYKEKNSEIEDRYKKEAEAKSRELRKREQQHLKLARQKKRNLSAFRSALVDLTYQIDELENLKYSHYRTALDLSQETSEKILDYSALVVRAEIEVFDKIAQKGWPSGELDDLLARAGDPFATNSGYGHCRDGEIFSILPTESILPSPHDALSRAGSISGGTAMESKYRSLSAALSQNGDFDEYDDEDTNSIFSGGFSNPGPSKSRLGLPGFSPSASSAGWGNIDPQSYGSEAPESTIGERTEPTSKSRGSDEAEAGAEWQDSKDDSDIECRTLREHPIN